MDKTCIFFSPHQDDACFGCGGVIYKKIKKKEKVYIVNVCNGKNVFRIFFGIKENPTPEEVEKIRNEEDIKAMGHLGVPKANIIFLGFDDGLSYYQRKEVEKKICELIKKINPSEIFIPSDKDLHPDHMITNEIVIKCLKNIKFKKSVYEYFIYLKSKIDKKNNLIKININDAINYKKKAIKEYKSQLELFLPIQNKPFLDKKFLNNFYKTVEIFRRIDISKNNNIFRKCYKKLKICYISSQFRKKINS